MNEIAFNYKTGKAEKNVKEIFNSKDVIEDFYKIRSSFKGKQNLFHEFLVPIHRKIKQTNNTKMNRQNERNSERVGKD